MKQTYLLLGAALLLTGCDNHCKKGASITASITYITNDTFQKEVLQADKPVLIDFYADWCIPCTMMAPIYEETSKRYVGRIKFTKLNIGTWKHPKVKEYNIHSIPQILLFKEGKEKGRMMGYMEKDELVQKIEQLIQVK